MKNTMTEARFLVYVLAATGALMLIRMFHPQIAQAYDPTNYVSFHAVLEFFSISVSMTIFLYCWKAFETGKSRVALFFIYIFYTVGMIDLLHTLTFKGMPFFLNESSVAKATSFWIIGRMIEAALMVVVMLLPDKKLERDWRWPVIGASILTIAASMAVVFIFEKQLPVLVIEGQGTTPLKNVLEYIISSLHFAALVICLYKYYLHKRPVYLNLGMAFTLLFLSEMIFTVYQSVFDLDNFTGHIYKMLGYYFILKGIYQILMTEEAGNPGASKAEHIIKENCTAVCSIVKKEENFVFSYMEGGLVRNLGYRPERLAGKLLEDVLPASAGEIMDYCTTCWEYAEKQTFTAVMNERYFIITLAPDLDEGVVTKLTGVIMEVSQLVHSGGMNKAELVQFSSPSQKGKSIPLIKR